jgi:hypothetical protein
MKIKGKPPVRVSCLPSPSREQILAVVRERLVKMPGAELILQVHSQLAARQPVAPDLLDRARTTLLGYTTRQLTAAGIRLELTNKAGLTQLEALMAAFPLLGLKREDRINMCWTTLEDGIRNVRSRLFKNNPGLELDVKQLEQEFDSGRYRLRNVYEMNRLRLRIIGLITPGNLNRWGLGTYKNVPYFGTPEAVAAKCFPFIAHPVFASIRRTEAPQTFEEFSATFYSAWKVGAYFARQKSQLTVEQLAQAYSDLVVNAAATRKSINEELLAIYRMFGGVLNLGMVDKVKLDSVWVKKYTILVFYDLFGKSCADHLKNGFLQYLKAELAKK